MAKRCDVCKLSYPNHHTTCPHCAAKASSAAKQPAEAAVEIFDEDKDFDSGVLEALEAEERSSDVVLIDEDLPEAVAEAEADFNEAETVPPGRSSRLQDIEPLELRELDVDDPASPPTMVGPLPSPLLSRSSPASPHVPAKSGGRPAPMSLLAQEGAKGGASGKATNLAAGAAPKTHLARPEEIAALLGEEKGPSPADPKATKVAAGSKQPTMVAPPEDLEALLDEEKQPSPKATKLAPMSAPITKLAAGSTPITTLTTAPKTMLPPPGAIEASLDEKMPPAEGEEEPAVKVIESPKATKMAAQSAPPTQLAAGAAPVTKMAAGAAPRTMLAPPEVEDEDLPTTRPAPLPKVDTTRPAPLPKVEPPSPKATKMAAQAAPVTKMAAGAAPRTMLAPPEDDDSLDLATPAPAPLPIPLLPKATKLAAQAAPVTKLAAGAAPATSLASPDDLEALGLEAPPPRSKATKLASGAAQFTKLAPAEEQDLLSLPEAAPKEDDDEFDYGVENSSVDLGSGPRLGKGGPSIAELTEEEPELETADLSAAEDKPAKPAKPAKKAKGGFGRFVIGGFLGTLTGAAACVALCVYDVVPLDEVKKLVGIEVTKTPNTSGSGESLAGLPGGTRCLNDGDFAKAVEVLDKVNPPNEECLAKRGQARWLNYLQKQNQANAALDENAKDVVQAKKELADSKQAEGKFWLGHIEEIFERRAAARAIYLQGVDEFRGNETHRRLFQSALNRLDSLPAKGDSGARGNPLDPDKLIEASVLFPVLFTALLAAPGADGGGDEAGAEFWNAAKLAKEKKYAEAIDALRKARALHDRQRWVRLRKAQNPVSDPTEEIFLRNCDELSAYWEFRKAAKENGYDDLNLLLTEIKGKGAGKTLADIVDRLKKDPDVAKADPNVKDPVKSLDVLSEAKKSTETQLAEIKTALDAVKLPSDKPKELAAQLMKQKAAVDALAAAADTLKPGKYVDDEEPASVSKGVVKLLEAKKTLDKNIQDLKDTINPEAEKTVEALATILGEAQVIERKDKKIVNKEIVDGVNSLLMEKYSPAVTALTNFTVDLTTLGNSLAKNLDMSGPLTDLAKNFNLGAALAASEKKNGLYETRLQQSRTPQKMLDLWLVLLRDRERKDMAKEAELDSQRVAQDNGASAEDKAEALCVKGLALRNQGKYDEARKELAEAVKGVANPREGDWRLYALDALKEMNDPTAYYVPQAEALWASGLQDVALALLNRGLEVFPNNTKERGQLLSVRSIMNLELALARANGKLNPEDPLLAEVRNDAQAAVAAGAKAEGHYATGRLAERLGKWAEAHKNYRQAVAAHPVNDRAGSVYRLALARVLLKFNEKPPEDIPEKEKPDEKKLGRLPEAEEQEAPAAQAQTVSHLLAALAVLVPTAALADDDEPEATPELDEAIRLAEQSIKAGNPEGHLTKALALAKKGYWTIAVLEYAEGLQKMSRNPEHAEGLRYLIENHPAFKVPDGLRGSDPIVAEKHYAAGLRHYWVRKYSSAEKEFYEAVRFNDQDARYLYFLGLARLSQNKRASALESFRRGGLLEQQGKPNGASIAATLERIQGSSRETLNRYRP